MKDKKYEIDMCNGPILKKMLLFTIPLIFSSMLLESLMYILFQLIFDYY